MTTTDQAPTSASPDLMRNGADATTTALGHIARAISSDFPWASADHVGEVLRSSYERTRDAKVQNYRLVLAERGARAQLRHEQRRSCAGDDDR